MGAKASRIEENNAASEQQLNHESIDEHHINSISDSFNYADENVSRLTTKEFTWGYGGQSVYVAGGWDEWRTKIALSRVDHDHFRAVLCLPLGTYQYKFIVDGNWKHNPGLPTERDEHGNLNNIVNVALQVPEYDSNEPLSGDNQTRSPMESYDFTILPKEHHTTEPPTLPILLTSKPCDGSQNALSGTGFVRLNHMFSSKNEALYGDANIRTLTTETRYQSKVVRTVLVTTTKKTMEVRLPIGLDGV